METRRLSPNSPPYLLASDTSGCATRGTSRPPPPAPEPAVTGAASGMAPPAADAAPRPPSAATDDETLRATTEPWGTAGTVASLHKSGAPSSVDGVAPASSGATLRGVEAMDEDDVPLPLPKKARIERRPHLVG